MLSIFAAIMQEFHTYNLIFFHGQFVLSADWKLLIHLGFQGSVFQSCKSRRAFQVEFGLGPGLGLKLAKISGLIRAWEVLFVLGEQKYNQNNLATLLNFSDLT